MGRDGAVLEQSRPREKKGARADGDEPAHAGRRLMQPVDQPRLGAGALDPGAPGHDQSIDVAQLVIAAVGRDDLEAAGRFDGTGVQGDDECFIAGLVVPPGELQAVVGVLKHVQGAAKVDNLDIGEDEECDSASPQRLFCRGKLLRAAKIRKWQ